VFRIATQETDKPFEAKIEGVFSSGMYDYDANLVFLGEADARRIFQASGGLGLSVAVRDADQADAVKKRLAARLGSGYSVRSWMDLNRTFFAALKLEKITMFVILALIILVASLNIAGSLTILVMDKTRDIGVLKAIGLESGRVARIFAWDGLILGLLGAGTGLGLGLGICWFLAKFRIVDLPKDIYYIEKLPVLVNAADVSWVVGTAVALSFLSALYPAVTAVRLDPVKALRAE
jgi:lipoprotein-releasing system permease protein